MLCCVVFQVRTPLPPSRNIDFFGEMADPSDDSSGQKKCSHCRKVLPIDAFGTRVVKGEAVVMAVCVPCVPKKNANNAKYKQSDKGKAANAKYDQSDKGKATNAKYKAGPSNALARKRELAIKKKRRKMDPAFRMMNKVACAARHLVTGEVLSSPTFVQRTGFESEGHFLRHLAKNLPDGMEMRDHGKKWHIEHKIPQEAYDFSDPDEVKKCWSPFNVRGLDPRGNFEKSIQIIDEMCYQATVDLWPKWFNRTLPDEKTKQEFYAKCKASHRSEAEEDEESEEEFSDSDEESEEDSSESGEGPAAMSEESEEDSSESDEGSAAMPDGSDEEPEE